MTLTLVFLGAIVGAPLRYLTDRVVQTHHDSLFPWGTLTINTTGSFILGALTGMGSTLPGPAMTLLGTGFCGALTTYSTFGYETVRLTEQRAYFYAATNIAISIVAGLGAALLGYTAAHALVA